MPSDGPGTGARLATLCDAPFYDAVTLWIDAADTSTIGPSVATVKDKSRFNCQIAGTSVTHGTIIGNQPAFTFTYDTSLFTITNGPNGNPTNRYVWCIYKDANNALHNFGGKPMLENTGSDSPAWRIASTDTTSGYKQDLLESGIAHHIPSSQTDWSLTKPTILAMQYTPSTLAAYLDGAQNGSTLSHSFVFSGTTTTYKVGYIGFATYSLEGQVCELVVVDENLTPRERAWLDCYGAAKWQSPLVTTVCSPPLVFA